MLRINCAPVHEKDLGWRLRQDADLCEPLDEHVIGKYTNIKRTQKYWIDNPMEEDLGADTRRESLWLLNVRAWKIQAADRDIWRRTTEGNRTHWGLSHH
jgi:hypothetical protein